MSPTPYATHAHTPEGRAQEDGIADERDRGVYHTGYYRPLMNFTYFIDYRLWGMKAAGFRITNWFFHLLTCLILYELMGLLTRRDVWPLLGALLFAVHPVQTEAVSMIVSRNNIFATCFTLVALFGYIRWWQKKSAPALTCFNEKSSLPRRSSTWPRRRASSPTREWDSWGRRGRAGIWGGAGFRLEGKGGSGRV